MPAIPALPSRNISSLMMPSDSMSFLRPVITARRSSALDELNIPIRAATPIISIVAPKKAAIEIIIGFMTEFPAVAVVGGPFRAQIANTAGKDLPSLATQLAGGQKVGRPPH